MKPQYFALVNDENVVINVIVCTSEEIQKFPGKWIETFHEHPTKRYAGVGDTYDEQYNDFFPDLSWTPDLETIKQWGYPPPFEHLRPSE